jgi:hypothetical protein
MLSFLAEWRPLVRPIPTSSGVGLLPQKPATSPADAQPPCSAELGPSGKRKRRPPGRERKNLHNYAEEIPGGTKTGIMRDRENDILPRETGYVFFFR